MHLVYYTKSIAKNQRIAKQEKTVAAQICSFALEHAPSEFRMCLFGLSKAHPVVVTIKDCVVLADEHISQNPQGPGRWRDVQTHEAAQTNGLSSLTLLEDILLSGQSVALSAYVEGDDRQRWDLTAVHQVLSLDEWNGSDGLLQGLDLGGRASDQRGSSVYDGFTASLTQTQLAANCHSIHVDLPVGLPGDVDIVEITIVVFGVGSSQEQLTTGFCVRVPVQVEGEDILLHFLLVHDVVKHRHHPIHGDFWVGHAEDAIKLRCDESHTGLLDGLSKDLFLY